MGFKLFEGGGRLTDLKSSHTSSILLERTCWLDSSPSSCAGTWFIRPLENWVAPPVNPCSLTTISLIAGNGRSQKASTGCENEGLRSIETWHRVWAGITEVERPWNTSVSILLWRRNDALKLRDSAMKNKGCSVFTAARKAEPLAGDMLAPWC